MIKLTKLREHLLQAIPELTQNPDKLLTFVNDGNIQFMRGQSLSHHYRVDARLVFIDYSGSLDAVMIPLLQWLTVYQPDLPAEESIQLEAEILDNQRWDLSLTVRLTERVVARVNQDTGRIESEHRMPEFPLEAMPPKHWQLFTREHSDPDYDLTAEWYTPAGSQR